MRDLGPSWTLAWADLPPGTYGLTDHWRQTITLQRGMTYEERRCTIAHEVEHARRGPVPRHRIMQEERRALHDIWREPRQSGLARGWAGVSHL